MNRQDSDMFVNHLMDSARQKMFQHFIKAERDKIRKDWAEALEPYSIKEVNRLMKDGYYIPQYNYSPEILDDLIDALDEQRYEESEEGIREQKEAFARYQRSIADLKTRSLPEEESPMRKPSRYDCRACNNSQRDLCSGGVCMRILGYAGN